jgi:lysophospholipid hydrolase
MAASSGIAHNVEHSVMAVSESISTLVQSFSSPTGSMKSAISSAVALANITAMEHRSVQRSWFAMFGRMILFLFKVIPGALYWLITFTTITLPTFLFTLFSTSLTFTMNATTLWVWMLHFL